MDRTHKLFGAVLGSMLCAIGTASAGDDGPDSARYCMDVNIAPFHMLPGYTDSLGPCAVRDYLDGELQAAFYPFTKEAHKFNCDYFADVPPDYGAAVTLPNGKTVPSSVVSDGEISGTIGGHAFSAMLYCASQTNWYQDSCTDPDDPATCKFQLAQPFMTPSDDLDFYPRVTEVSVFDGKITVKRRRGYIEIPILMATRAAGMTHVESLDPPQVGATITHSALGMLTYTNDGDKGRVLDGSLDLLLQGHIFHPDPVGVDKKAAVIKGSICSKELYQLLNRARGKGKRHHHDD